MQSRMPTNGIHAEVSASVGGVGPRPPLQLTPSFLGNMERECSLSRLSNGQGVLLENTLLRPRMTALSSEPGFVLVGCLSCTTLSGLSREFHQN